MDESTLRWPTDKEREEMEEVCSISEVPHTEKTERISLTTTELTNKTVTLAQISMEGCRKVRAIGASRP